MTDLDRAIPSGDSVSADRPARPDSQRLASNLRTLGEIGVDPLGGVSRLCFTPAERRAHEVVGGWLKALGLEVRSDAVGNSFGFRKGRRANAPAIAVGSHLDTVRQGGAFDGAVGVVGAIELVRMLDEAGITTESPLMVVAFAGEESSRFGDACIGSKSVTGEMTEQQLRRLQDDSGISLADAMLSLGLEPQRLPSARWNPATMAAYFELHIEQARMLESEGIGIGVVDVISGSTRLRLDIQGRAEHSGGTPMHLRRDAVTAAAEIILAVESLANDPRHRGTRATVGRMDIRPNNMTTIPGRVVLTVDLRDVDTDRQRAAARQVVEKAYWICERRGVVSRIEVLADTSPAVLPMWLRDVMGRTCRELDTPFRTMSSGAGHDAAIISRVVPAGMFFVPCRQGLSHVPEEWASVADIARGVETLYHAVLKLDALLAKWATP